MMVQQVKHYSKKLAMALVFFALVVYGGPCASVSASEVKKETQELIEAVKSYTAEQRDEAMEKTRSALDNMDRRIDALKKRMDDDWDKMDKAARENAKKSMEELRKQREKVAEQYARFKGSATDTWENVKKGFSDAYQALYDSWEKSERQFGVDKK